MARTSILIGALSRRGRRARQGFEATVRRLHVLLAHGGVVRAEDGFEAEPVEGAVFLGGKGTGFRHGSFEGVVGGTS